MEGGKEIDIPAEESSKPNKYIFISGMFGTDKGIAPIDLALKDYFGQDNVLSYNSSVSSDQPDLHSEKKIADSIETFLSNGERLTVIAHSLGATELYRCLRHIEESESDFLKQNVCNLNIVLLAPAGFFEGLSKSASFLKRVIEVARTQPTTAFKALPSQLQGIESTVLIPIQNMDDIEITDVLKSAFPKRSQYCADDPRLYPSNNLTDRKIDYRRLLTEEERENLDAIDSKLVCASNIGDWIIFKGLLKQRGRLLSRVAKLTYEGCQSEKELKKINAFIPFAVAKLGIPLLIDAVIGKPYKYLLRLIQQGVAVDFVIPEYDVVVKIDEIIEFYQKADIPLSKLPIMRPHTHLSFAFQPEALIQALKVLQPQS